MSDACNQCRGWRRDGAMGSCRRSAPCALRCRARWIPASAGMTGACAGTTGAPLRPVCAPLSRTLDSSLRWNDGGLRGGRRGLRGGRRGRPSAPCALRCRARWIPAFAGMTGPARGTTGPARGTAGAPLRPVCAPLSRTLDSSLRWNDGGLRWNDGACAGDGGGGAWRDEVCGHCSNQRGYGVRGNCRWFGDGTTSRTLNSYPGPLPDPYNPRE